MICKCGSYAINDDPKGALCDKCFRDVKISALKAQRDELLELLKWADAKLGPEINPSNYDHQDVCELNANMVEVTLAIRAAIANAENAKP